jgi:hypothetical protein
MLPKPLNQIERADIDALVANQISEGASLELKRQPIIPNEEVARDVGAMANSGGGDIILGVSESNGIAQSVTPFPNGEDEANRVVSIVLTGVSPRLTIGTQVITGPGGDVVVVRVGRARIPAMVHLGNRTDFWERRDRQRVRMTHAEIVSRIREGLAETQRRDEFIRQRIEQFRTRSGGHLGFFLSVTPETLSASEIVSIRDAHIQKIMSDPSRVRDTLIIEATPQPTLEGLRSARREIQGYRFEIHRNGNIELQLPNARELLAWTTDTIVWDPRGPGGRRIEVQTVLAGGLIARSVIETIGRAKRVYDLSGMFEPFVLTLALVNASGTLLPGRIIPGEEGAIVEEPGTLWTETTLLVQIPGLPEEVEGVTAKRLCDLIWQAYGRWGCGYIDDQGLLTTEPSR